MIGYIKSVSNLSGKISTASNLVGKITKQNQTKSVYIYNFISYAATELNSNIYTYKEKESEELTQ